MFTEFVKELEQKNIQISFEGGKIKYEGPEESVTPELIEQLKKYKGNLIKYHWPAECVNMMPINPAGNKIPLILVYFEVMNYPLSDYMGKDQPFYGFLHHGSKGEKILYESVESYAKDYIKQLQKVIPEGPYILGGFSFGGILAYEMAIQLRQAGFEVPFLALLDTMSPIVFNKHPQHRDLLKLIKSEILGPYSRKIMSLMKMSVCNLFFLLKKPVPVILRNFYIVNTYCTLTLKYQPGQYDGEILLFRLNDPDCLDKYYGWDSLVRKIKVFTYSGTHLSIAREKEYAELIGSALSNNINQYYRKS